MGNGTTNWGQTLVEQASHNGRFYFRVAYGILRDSNAAEDACQQAMLKAWEQAELIRDGDRIQAWLTRVVVNESLQVLRKRKREREALARQAGLNEQSVDPGDGLAARETVRLALDELPEPTRTVVVLRLINGLSGNEVKRMLGCSASEVSRRLHVGMDQLRVWFTREREKV